MPRREKTRTSGIANNSSSWLTLISTSTSEHTFRKRSPPASRWPWRTRMPLCSRWPILGKFFSGLVAGHPQLGCQKILCWAWVRSWSLAVIVSLTTAYVRSWQTQRHPWMEVSKGDGWRGTRNFWWGTSRSTRLPTWRWRWCCEN